LGRAGGDRRVLSMRGGHVRGARGQMAGGMEEGRNEGEIIGGGKIVSWA